MPCVSPVSQERGNLYPKLTIHLNKIAVNVRRMVQLCGAHGIEITGVTKVFRGDPQIARVYLENGISRLGDSRVANLKKLDGMPCERWLLRMPQLWEADDAVRHSDVSLNSELAALQALEQACRRQSRRHKVVLMVDLGDLREGWLDPSELSAAADYVRASSHLDLYGIGTNLTCLSFVQPDTEKLTRLLDLSKRLGGGLYVSGGNSATLDLMLRGGIPAGVNLLRLGESLLFGRERACYRYLEGTYNDAFLLQAQVIESKEKPSMPWGKIGKDSYGNRPVFTDKGVRRRVICALGRQDCDTETMWPVDPGISIIGASSDHLVLDVTDSARDYPVGAVVAFRLGYFSLMRAYTSDYVAREYRP